MNDVTTVTTCYKTFIDLCNNVDNEIVMTVSKQLKH